MANRYWDGGTSTDHANINNWSDTDGGATPASSVPGTGDTAHFTVNGAGNPCTLTAPWVLGGLITLVGYNSKIDLATFDLTMDDGADIDFAMAGTFDAGSGTISLTNGNFDYADLGTLTAGSAVLSMAGTGTLTGSGLGASDRVNSLTITGTGVIAIAGNGGVNTGIMLVEAGGSASIAGGIQWVLSSATLQLEAGTTIGGSGILSLFESDITQQDGEISADCIVQANATVVGGNYSNRLRFQSLGASNRTKVLTGAFDVGRLEFEATSSGNHAIDATAVTAMTISGDFTIDMNGGGGDVTVDCTGSSAVWEFQGDVIDEIDGDTFVWTAGSTTHRLSGLSDQNIDWGGTATPNLTISKPTSGDVTLVDVDLTIDSIDMADNLTVTSGDVDTATSATCAVGGDMTLANNLLDLGDSTVWTIGGDFDYSGITTLTDGSSTVVMTGVSKTITGDGSQLNNVTIASGATITAILQDIVGELTVAGQMSVPNGAQVVARGDCDMVITGAVTGAGTGELALTNITSGHGLLTQSGTVDVPIMRLRRPFAGAILAAGVYASANVVIDNNAGVSRTMQLTGPYVFSGNLSFENTSTGTLIVDNATNNPSYSVGGNLTFVNSGGGTLTYTKGTGLITVTANSTFTTIGANLEAITVTGGTFTQADDLDTVDGLTIQSGATWDNDGNDVDIANGGDLIVNGAVVGTSLDGATFTVAGNTRFNNLDTSGSTATWDIDVTGSLSAFNSIIENSDASGGSAGVAYFSTENTGNTNWTFVAAIPFFQQIITTSTVKDVNDLFIPPLATGAEIQASDQNASYTMDGTVPTQTDGMMMLTTHSPKTFTITDVQKIQFVRASGSNGNLNIHYFG